MNAILVMMLRLKTGIAALSKDALLTSCKSQDQTKCSRTLLRYATFLMIIS